MAILLSINSYDYFGIDTISYNWTDSFEEFFASYSSDGNNSKIITISYYNSYLLHLDLKSLIFEGVPNCNDYSSSYNPKSPNLESHFDGESQILSSKDDIFTVLSDSNLLES